MIVMLNKRNLFSIANYRSILAFTFIELMVVLAIIAVLTSIISINLSNLIPRANLFTTTDILIAEIRHQQLRAMNREKNNEKLASEYGIHVQAKQYTLFSGSTYDVNDPNNLVNEIESTLELSTNFPDQIIVFAQGSGEILNFNNSLNTISVIDNNTGQVESITFNLYGVPQ